MFYYVMGVTCAGKDTMMERAAEMYPNLVGLVQVGKEFRKRYPPGYFKGSGAPKHTEVEAIEIFNEQINLCSEKKIVFICGQPRATSQIPLTIGKYPGTVVWMNASQETLVKRLEKRFPGDKEALQLSLARLTNDRYELYDVCFNLMKQGHTDFVTFDGDYEDVDTLIHNLVHFPKDEK